MKCKICGRKATKVNVSVIRNGAGERIVKDYVCRLHANINYFSYCTVNKLRMQEYGFVE